MIIQQGIKYGELKPGDLLICALGVRLIIGMLDNRIFYINRRNNSVHLVLNSTDNYLFQQEICSPMGKFISGMRL